MYVKVVRESDQKPRAQPSDEPYAAPYVAMFECTSARWLADPNGAHGVLIEMEGSPCAAYHLAPEEMAFILSDTGKTIDRVSLPA